ncbi:hypothetical protein GCM10011494_01650 [Novosphingobium endophyticum]|uniref:DUF4197 domain-containing protein n=1 Tax=Novosphingobium endophyticum TaxID=1955250 RepID=A0A916TNN4_9SPHN|nr:DUF4197 domain-containing protein [Novosphingobium endophyticum]GGB86995.1 hypothetical protein GCM10011494_01650 [Novosphingobium endophyticum]
MNRGSSENRGVSGGVAIGRRAALGGLLAYGVLALPGCTSMGRTSHVEVVRRLLEASTRQAFAQLTRPDGFWDSAVARIELPVLFGRTGSIAAGVLKSRPFREQLQHQLNNLAEDGARKAAPLVAEAVRHMSIPDALALLKAGRTGATTYLRDQMGPALVNAMIPELGRVMRLTDDPFLGQALALLAGVDVMDAAHALALEADNAIWYEIGAAEAAIRANPEMTRDPVLIAGLKLL